jgi:hypothetical protein
MENDQRSANDLPLLASNPRVLFVTQKGYDIAALFGHKVFKDGSGLHLSAYRFSWSFACSLAILFSLTPGCVVVPVRVPTQTRDVSGKVHPIDFSFLKSGSTTREEVMRNLTAIDTGVKQANFFWGRWDNSRWRSTAVGFVPPEGERIWRARNLLIAFDANGIVNNWIVLNDKQLDEQLDRFAPVETIPPPDLSQPLHVNMRVPSSGQADTIQAVLVLSTEFFEEQRTSPAGHSFFVKTPRSNLLKIVPTPEAPYYGPVSDFVPFSAPNLLVTTVYLEKPVSVHYGDKKHAVGKKLVLGIDAPTFLLLRRYVREAR